MIRLSRIIEYLKVVADEKDDMCVQCGAPIDDYLVASTGEKIALCDSCMQDYKKASR